MVELALVKKAIEQGWIWDLSNAAYHGGPGISKTGLTKLERSPAHYQADKKGLIEITPQKQHNLDFGNGFHTWTLEMEKFFDEYRAPTKLIPFFRFEWRSIRSFWNSGGGRRIGRANR